MNKKYIFFAFIFFTALVAISAQEEDTLANTTEIINMEVLEQKIDRTTTVTIQYYPLLKEARFIYTTSSATFETGKALQTIREQLEIFMKERGYYHYSYTRKDDTKYDNKQNKAIYTSFFSFEK